MTKREKFIILVDNDIVHNADAIILLEGDGANRIDKAVELFKKGLSDCLVFSGEIDDADNGSFNAKKVIPILLEKGIPKEKIIHENKSTNTHEQALEVVKLASVKKWRKMILVASHYHQYRAYLTFLKVIQDQHLSIIIYNSPARALEWFKETGWGKRIQLLEKEIAKIYDYSKLNHIATFQSAIEYQKWKEQQV